MALRSFSMFVYGSHTFAMFMPMHYVMGMAMRAHKRDNHYQNLNCGYLLALYGLDYTLWPYLQATFTAFQCNTLKSLFFSVFYSKASWENIQYQA